MNEPTSDRLALVYELYLEICAQHGIDPISEDMFALVVEAIGDDVLDT